MAFVFKEIFLAALVMSGILPPTSATCVFRATFLSRLAISGIFISVAFVLRDAVETNSVTIGIFQSLYFLFIISFFVQPTIIGYLIVNILSACLNNLSSFALVTNPLLLSIFLITSLSITLLSLLESVNSLEFIYIQVTYLSF